MSGPADEAVVGGYLELGLQFGRHIEGFVDSYFGDPELAARVAAAAPPAPGDLAARAAALRAGLADSGLAASRRRFLGGQLSALECTALRLSGVEVPFIEEVRSYFDVELELGDPDGYAEAHDRISDLLPGSGDLRARVEAFYARNVVPPERLLQAVLAVSGELRARVGPMFGLPSHERVSYEVVRDKPWNAFNRYLGDCRSEIALNATAGRTLAALPLLATHEAYPGHHTERCRKERVAVADHGHAEQAIALVNTPQCLIEEGTAELAVTAVIGPGWGAWTAEILAEHGIHADGELVELLLDQVRRLMPVRLDAALMLHDRGADVDEVVDYVRRWMLLPEDRARQMLAFMTDPLWRAYSVTYVEGFRLIDAWLAAGPGPSLHQRYQRLLDEPVLPSTLRADLRTRSSDGRNT